MAFTLQLQAISYYAFTDNLFSVVDSCTDCSIALSAVILCFILLSMIITIIVMSIIMTITFVTRSSRGVWVWGRVGVKIIEFCLAQSFVLQCYMRALYSYDPSQDTLLPTCPSQTPQEIGLKFDKGDILQVIIIFNTCHMEQGHRYHSFSTSDIH